MRHKFFYILLLLCGGIISLFLTCGRKTAEKEGIILYEVSYPKLPPDHFMMSFLPKEMTLKFKDGNYCSELSAGMGMFKTSFIIDGEKRMYYQTLKILNKKYYSKLDKKGIQKMLKKLPVYHFSSSDAPAQKIAGYLSYPMIAHSNTDTFTIFYTHEIILKDPYWATQYQPIKGLIMQYRLENYGLCMELRAKQIDFIEIDDSDFNVPPDYKKISQEEMDKEMSEIFENF